MSKVRARVPCVRVRSVTRCQPPTPPPPPTSHTISPPSKLAGATHLLEGVLEGAAGDGVREQLREGWYRELGADPAARGWGGGIRRGGWRLTPPQEDGSGGLEKLVGVDAGENAK